MSLIAVPTSPSQNRKWALKLGAPALAVLALAVVFWLSRGMSSSSSAIAGQFYSVVPMDMDVKITKDGELAAINNIDIVCNVEGQTTITTIVDEGSYVKKGDVLCTLDSSAIKQKIEDTTLDLQKAEADLTTSKEMKEIQESQNAANLEAAQVALTLAQLDLQGYTEGTYPQDLENAQTTLEMAKITLKNKEEDLSQTKNLFSKGFVTASDVKTSELAQTTATNAVSQAETALKVLTEFTHPKDLASKKNALSQADKSLQRTKRENAANLSQKIADMQAKTQSYEVIKRRMDHLQEQLAACTIAAPADGMVVYASSGDRWAQTQIVAGAQVREHQALLRLPDTSSMKAIARIGEGQVGKLSLGLRAKVRVAGYPQPIGATVNRISVLADSSQRWFNPDLKEYPVDLVLDDTPNTFKPGMGTNVEILVNHLEHVLAVPLAAIYSAGPDAYVFVREGEKVKPVKVKIGQSNETHVQIKDGIEAGAEVLLLQAGQGRDLLEQNGIKVEGPTTRGSDDGFGQRRNRKRDGASGDAARPDASRANGAGAPANGAGAPANGAGAPANGAGVPANGAGAPANGAGAPGNVASPAPDAPRSDRLRAEAPTTAPSAQ